MSVEGGSDQVRQFERYILAYLDDLYRAARRLTGQTADAEDLVQETCLCAFQALEQLRRFSAAKVWVFSILRSTFLRRIERGPGRGAPVSLEEIEGSPLTTGGLHDSYESFLPMGQSTVQETRHAILNLPLPYREAVVLAHIGGFSYREMAQILAVPVETVMSRLFRGRRMLRAGMAERVSPGAHGVSPRPPALFPDDHGAR